MKKLMRQAEISTLALEHPEAGKLWLHARALQKLSLPKMKQIRAPLRADRAGYAKDASTTYIVGGNKDAVNPAQSGTKAAAHYSSEVPEVAASRSAAPDQRKNPAAQKNPA